MKTFVAVILDASFVALGIFLIMISGKLFCAGLLLNGFFVGILAIFALAIGFYQVLR